MNLCKICKFSTVLCIIPFETPCILSVVFGRFLLMHIAIPAYVYII